jgi:hypothetical protein
MAASIRSRAAQAVLRGRGWKPGQKLDPKIAKEAKYNIKRAAESHVYRHLEEGTHPSVPSPEEQERIRYLAIMRSHAQEKRSRGPGVKRITDPEQRKAIMEWSRKLASSPPHKEPYTKKLRHTFTPRSVQEKIDQTALLRERRTVARMPGVIPDMEWIEVDHVAGKREDGQPWLIAVGSGFSATIYLVWADHQDTAAEIAEERWPRAFFSDIVKNPPEEDGEMDEGYDFIPSLGKFGKREEDIRFFVKATEVSLAKQLDSHDRLFRLTDGRVVRVAA